MYIIINGASENFGKETFISEVIYRKTPKARGEIADSTRKKKKNKRNLFKIAK